jgi:Trm5-related predicted tRNA methylase
MCYVEAGSYIRNNFTIIARLYGADHKFIGAIEELGEYSTIVRKIIAEKHLHIIKPIEPPAPKIFADQSVATRNAAISALELVNALFATGAELRAFMKDKSFTVENIHTNIETLKISSPGVLGGPRVEYRFHRGLDWHPSVEAFLRLYRE